MLMGEIDILFDHSTNCGLPFRRVLMHFRCFRPDRKYMTGPVIHVNFIFSLYLF